MSENFSLNLNRCQILSELSDADAGKVFKAIVKYVECGESEMSDRFLDLILRNFKVDIDAFFVKKLKCDNARRENGKKGGRPRKQAVSTEKPPEPIQEDSSEDNAPKTRERKKITQKASELSLFGDSLPPVAQETKKKCFQPPTAEQVESYCKEMRYNLDAVYFVNFYAARGWFLTTGTKMRDWKAAVNYWIRKPNMQPHTASSSIAEPIKQVNEGEFSKW